MEIFGKSGRQQMPETFKRAKLNTAVVACLSLMYGAGAHAGVTTSAPTSPPTGFGLWESVSSTSTNDPDEVYYYLEVEGKYVDGSGDVGVDYVDPTSSTPSAELPYNTSGATLLLSETVTVDANSGDDFFVDFDAYGPVWDIADGDILGEDGGNLDASTRGSISDELIDHGLAVRNFVFDLTDVDQVELLIGSNNRAGSSNYDGDSDADDNESIAIYVGGDSGSFTLENQGDVIGATGSAVELGARDETAIAGLAVDLDSDDLTSDVVVTNGADDNSSAVILSGGDGIAIRDVSDVHITNYGAIEGLDRVDTPEGYGIRISDRWNDGTGDREVTAASGNLTITNQASGFIYGEVASIFAEEIEGRSLISNYGTIGISSGDVGSDDIPRVGIELYDLGSNTSDDDALEILNEGVVRGETGIRLGGLQSTSGEPETGDLRITNTNGGQILGVAGSAIEIVSRNIDGDDSRFSAVDDDVRIFNLGSTSEIVGTSSSTDAGFGIDIGGEIGGNIEIVNSGVIEGLNPSDVYDGNDSGPDAIIIRGDVGGYVDISNSGTITGWSDGIDLGDDGDGIVGNVTITNTGTITGQDDDSIDINGVGEYDDSLDHVTVTINNSGSLISDDGSSGRVTIAGIGNAGSSDSSATVTINNHNGGVIRGESSNTDEIAIAVYDMAAADSNVIVINNLAGASLLGRIDIGDSSESFGTSNTSSALDDDSVTILNAGVWSVADGGSWDVTSLNGEDDTGEGVYVSHSMYFEENSGSASNVSISNTGTLNVTGGDYDRATFSGVDVFDNAGGIVDLTADSNDASTMWILLDDGQFKGQRTTTGDVNNNESLMRFDADLSSTSSVNLASSADRLVIVDGDAIGVTQIAITDSSQNAGFYLPNGAEIVRVDDGDDTAASAFALQGGAIEKGLWSYDLYADEGLAAYSETESDTLGVIEGDDISATEYTFDVLVGETSGSDDDIAWFLASSPSEYAHELPSMITNGQESWMEGAVAFRDHTANARLNLEPNQNAYEKPNGGAWIRAYGTKILMENRNDHVQATYGVTNSYQNNYDQRINGVVFGADRASYTDEGGTWLLGFMGGASHSDLTYTTSTTQMDLTSASLGMYASYLGSKGGFFNFLIKGDAGTTDYDMNSAVSGLEHDVRLDTTSYGAMMDFGYRFRASSAFFEPALSVASVTTDIDETNFLNTDVDFGNNTEVRSRLAFTTGVSFTTEDGSTWEPYVTVAGVHNSGDENTVRLTSAGSTTTVQDSKVETYAESAFGIRYVGNEGSYGYLRIDHSTQAGDDNDLGYSNREKSSVTAGMKITW